MGLPCHTGMVEWNSAVLYWFGALTKTCQNQSEANS